MDFQPLTLQLPSTTYQRLVELATQSERSVEGGVSRFFDRTE
jgi:hypothetical protein